MVEEETVIEGGVELKVPKWRDEVPTKKDSVFYNPSQVINRDFSILYSQAYAQIHSSEISVLDAFCATGVRGIRYLIEGEATYALFNDLNPLAVKLAQRNVDLNREHFPSSRQYKFMNLDANILMENERKENIQWKIIDIDPFGSPSPYFHSSVALVPYEGTICYTATDMQVLTGREPLAAYTNYGQTHYYRIDSLHEVALRTLIVAVQKIALQHDITLLPSLSLSTNHFIRVWLQRHRGIEKNQIYKQIGYIAVCLNPECNSLSAHSLGEQVELCPLCASRRSLIGPAWMGDMHSSSFLHKMIQLSPYGLFSTKSRISRLLERMCEEQSVNVPWFFDLHRCADDIGEPVPKSQDIIEWLENRGFRACRTHFKGTGVRTDANQVEIKSAIKELAK